VAMKTIVFRVQKAFGIFLQESGISLQGIKANRVLSFVLDIVFTGVSIKVMLNMGVNAIFLILASTVIAVLLFLLFRALVKFFSSLLGVTGKYLIKQSRTARFSCKLIPNVEKYRNAEYFIEIKNQEWFADAKDVKCNIELGARTGDFEDREIYNNFKDIKETRYVPVLISGKWISENENEVDIGARKSKRFRFIKADIVNDELIVFGSSGTDGNRNNISLPPRKNVFFVSVNGRIKSGTFFARFQILATYKGKDELYPIIEGSKFLLVDIDEETQTRKVSPWPVSNS